MKNREFTYCEGADIVDASLHGAALAIGNFDGFHRGHQLVIERLKATARRKGAPAVALSFEPHPRDFFARGAPLMRLTDRNSKRRLACALGLDGLIILNFDQELSQIEPRGFVDRFLMRGISCSSVIVGDNFRFGRNRGGDIDFLAGCGGELGFSVESIGLECAELAPISSTRIRQELSRGNVSEANSLLGFHWFIEAGQRGETPRQALSARHGTFFNSRLEQVAPGCYAIRGACGPWPLEGYARLSEERPGMFEAVWTDESPSDGNEPYTFAFIDKLGADAAARFRGNDLMKSLAGLLDVRPLTTLDSTLGFV